MQDSGINISIHKAHSIRAAASASAVMKGHSIEQVKNHANWSSKSNTFEKYYYKPFDKFQGSEEITTIIFSATEKTTTSLEPEAEATMIGTSMPSNQPVAEVEGEDEVDTHLATLSWLKDWFFPPPMQAQKMGMGREKI
jgi:hypothetical protein